MEIDGKLLVPSLPHNRSFHTVDVSLGAPSHDEISLSWVDRNGAVFQAVAPVRSVIEGKRLKSLRLSALHGVHYQSIVIDMI